jgi:hypothetical protein
VGVLGEIRRHWPQFCYAVAGTALPAVLHKSFREAGFWFHWWALRWPSSQLVLDLSPSALLALAALPVLAVALSIHREFRWASLFRTGAINLALITLGYYLFGYLLPWLSHPVAGDPYHGSLIIPGVLEILFFFPTFLVAAWLGCPSPQ